MLPSLDAGLKNISSVYVGNGDSGECLLLLCVGIDTFGYSRAFGLGDWLRGEIATEMDEAAEDCAFC